ncbi:hypothetical protein [Lysobacter enzymogenes]|uniref:hypothetical protein n=1 Tax=Lysobacter enzymogenes TaxID=69 RepID=UPI0019D19BAF|nr:hypothetical protein [Lysobacter enzymogenes]
MRVLPAYRQSIPGIAKLRPRAGATRRGVVIDRRGCRCVDASRAKMRRRSGFAPRRSTIRRERLPRRRAGPRPRREASAGFDVRPTIAAAARPMPQAWFPPDSAPRAWKSAAKSGLNRLAPAAPRRVAAARIGGAVR